MLSKFEKICAKLKEHFSNLRIIKSKSAKEEMKLNTCMLCLKLSKKKNTSKSYSLHDEDEEQHPAHIVKLHSKFGCTPAKIRRPNQNIDVVDDGKFKHQKVRITLSDDKKRRVVCTPVIRDQVWQQAFVYSGR